MPGIPIAAAFGVEWLLSFALMFVIMAVATDERVADGFAALAVGLTVGFCALMGGPLTGASMNPARSFGPALVGGLWRAHWLYWLSPITAMIVAARTYDLLREAKPPRVAPRTALVGVQGAIRDRADKVQSLETKRRLAAFLERHESGPLLPEELRAVRAVEFLESMATPAARALLVT